MADLSDIPGDDLAFARYLERKTREDFHARKDAPHVHKPRLNGAHRPQPEQEAEIRPIATIKASSWHGVATPQQFFLDERRLIPMGYATIFTGPGGVGKTMMSLQASVACVTGTKWLKGNVKRGPVLFFSAEDRLDVIHLRLDNYCRMKGIHLSALDDLHIANLSDVLDATIIKGDARTSVASVTHLYRCLDATLAEIKPVVLFLDNRSLLISGNENDRTIASMAMRLLQMLADKHGCAIVLLSHPSLTGITAGTGSSGSTAWMNTARSVINMTMAEDDEDARVLDNNKANYSKTGTKVPVKWMDGYFEATDAPPQSGSDIGKPQKAERVFMALLNLHTDLGIDVSPNPRSPNYAPVVFEAHQDREGFNRKWFKMAMDNLLKMKLIEVAEKGIPSRRIKYLKVVGVA